MPSFAIFYCTVLFILIKIRPDYYWLFRRFLIYIYLEGEVFKATTFTNNIFFYNNLWNSVRTLVISRLTVTTTTNEDIISEKNMRAQIINNSTGYQLL